MIKTSRSTTGKEVFHVEVMQVILIYTCLYISAKVNQQRLFFATGKSWEEGGKNYYSPALSQESDYFIKLTRKTLRINMGAWNEACPGVILQKHGRKMLIFGTPPPPSLLERRIYLNLLFEVVKLMLVFFVGAEGGYWRLTAGTSVKPSILFLYVLSCDVNAIRDVT